MASVYCVRSFVPIEEKVAHFAERIGGQSSRGNLDYRAHGRQGGRDFQAAPVQFLLDLDQTLAHRPHLRGRGNHRDQNLDRTKSRGARQSRITAYPAISARAGPNGWARRPSAWDWGFPGRHLAQRGRQFFAAHIQRVRTVKGRPSKTLTRSRRTSNCSSSDGRSGRFINMNSVRSRPTPRPPHRRPKSLQRGSSRFASKCKTVPSSVIAGSSLSVLSRLFSCANFCAASL